MFSRYCELDVKTSFPGISIHQYYSQLSNSLQLGEKGFNNIMF